jgi:hypothetical protein
MIITLNIIKRIVVNMDLQTAYHIIGLPDDCTLEELEERYHLLTETKATINQLDDIQTAYNLIRTHISKNTPKPKDPLKKRIGNFFYHYRAHLIFGIIGAIIIGTFSYSFINGQIDKRREANKPPADLKILLFGTYPEEDLTPLETRILDKFTNWKDVDIEFVYSPVELNSELDLGAMQASRIKLATTEPDLYIFDLYHLELFMEEGAFYSLDKIKNESSHTEDRWYLYKLMDDEEKHIYGIDISDLDLFSDLAIESNEKIVVMRLDTKNEENALEFLHTILRE